MPTFKFKIGDLVIGNKDANYYCKTRQGWIGKVTNVGPHEFDATQLVTGTLVGGALYTNLDYDSFDLYVEKTVFKVGNPNANNYGITRQGRTGRATHVSADGDHIRAISAAKGSGDTEFSLCPYCFDLDRAADDVIVNREFLKFIYSKGTVEIRQLIEQKFPDVSLEPEYFEFKEDSRILSHYGELPFCIGINNAIVPNEFSRKSLYVQEDYTASIGTALNGKNQYITFKKK